MSAINYFQKALKGIHQDFLEAVKDLTDEQLHFRPLGKCNHIAFSLWHLARTEDMVINFLVQKKNPVWNAEGWDKKLRMDPRAQGTGMSEQEAAAVKINNLQEFLGYVQNTFKTTESWLETVKDEDLDQVNDLPVLGKRSLYEVIGGTALIHAAEHLGEIWLLKGLQSLKGCPM
ncbi:MAG: DinB family protein [Deltaproteobacteria bacterium]|nr:DinB family protein [Deltaproteobacteria bacterium]